MKISPDTSDRATLTELGARLKRYRLTLDLTQAGLAEEAGVSKRTVERLEAGASTQLTNLVRLLRALGLSDHLDALIPAPLPSPLEQLQMQGRRRQRARRRAAPQASAEWSWGEQE